MSHEKHFSESKLWSKLKKYAKKAGQSVVYAVLLLFYVLQKPDLPMKSKAIVLSALGYFILPLDIIPDTLIGVGYGDDLGLLLVALGQIARHIDDEIKEKAKTKMRDWFGENIDTSEVDEKL